MELQAFREIAGVYALTTRPQFDDRGHFRDILRLAHLPREVADAYRPQQVSVSQSWRGVIRGLHFSSTVPGRDFFQTVACTEGAVRDALIDLRVGSPTFSRFVVLDLSPASALTLLVPPGVAHGYRVITDKAMLTYTMSRAFPEADTGCLRPDFPSLQLWQPGEADVTLSNRDRFAPTVEQARNLGLLPEWRRYPSR